MSSFDNKAERIRDAIYGTMKLSRKRDELIRLRVTAWKIKRAALREKYPNWTDCEVEEALRKIFLYAVT